MALAERIRMVRGDLTQTEFAREIGVNQSAISNYEAGRIPEALILEKIAIFGKTSVEWILRGDEPAHSVQNFTPAEYDVSLSEIETALLTAVITRVREVMLKTKLKLPPEKEARLIVRLYDDCRAQQLQPSRHQVERALLLVD